MQGISWLVRVYNAYSTPIKLAAGTAGVVAIYLIARQVLQSGEGQKRDEWKLVEGVEKICGGKHRVFEKIVVLSNSDGLGLAAANAIASAELNPQGLEKLTVYAVWQNSSWCGLFTIDGIFGYSEPTQTETEDTLALIFPSEVWSEQHRQDYKSFLLKQDKNLIALGKDHVLFGTYKDYRNLLNKGILPKVLGGHSLFNENALVEGVKEIWSRKYQVFENITVISNSAELAKQAAQAIARKGLKSQCLEPLEIYVLKSILLFRVFTSDGTYPEPNLDRKEKIETLVLFLPGKSPQEKETWETYVNQGETSAWQMVKDTGDEELIALGEDNVLFGAYKDYRNLLDNALAPKILREHSLFAKK